MNSRIEYWGDTPVLLDLPSSPVAIVILAHGAGAPMDTRFMELLSRSLLLHGLGVVRFEFPYMARRRAEARKFPPNRMPVLLEAWRNMVARCQESFASRLFIAGKSMGGRAASVLLAEGVQGVAGGIVFGYPFHPPGKPHSTRVEHLPLVQAPLLIIQGTRDALGRPEEVAGYDIGERTGMKWLETGDHDFKPLKKSGTTQQQLIDTACDLSAGFIRGIGEH